MPLEKGTAYNLRDLAEGPAYSISLTAENEQNVVKRLDFCLTLTGAEAESVAEGEGRRKRQRGLACSLKPSLSLITHAPTPPDAPPSEAAPPLPSPPRAPPSPALSVADLSLIHI